MNTDIVKTTKGKLTIVVTSIALIIIIVSLIILNPFHSKTFTVNQIYDNVYTDILKLDPESAPDFGAPKKYIALSNPKNITDISPKAIEHKKQLIKYWLDKLNEINYSKQTPKNKLNIDILKWYLNDALALARFSDYQYTVNSFSGVQMQTPLYLSGYKIENKQDAINYLVCLNKIKDKFNQTIQCLKRSKSKGIIPPKAILDPSIEEMNTFVVSDAKENMLYTSFVKKVSALELSNKEKNKLYRKAENEINNVVYPAYDKLTAYCNTLDAKAPEKLGVCNYKGGTKYYSALIHHYTGTNMTPDEVYDLGIKREKQIENQIKPLLKKIGLNNGSIGDRIAEAYVKMGSDSNQHYPDTDAGMQQALNDYYEIINYINVNISNLFDISPTNSIVVQKMTDLESEYTDPYYVSGAVDGSTPDVFFVPPTPQLKSTMQDLVYHEAIPGHHFQIAIQNEMTGVPYFRKIIHFTGFEEGWATYAENLAYENGFFEDSYSKLDYLCNQLNGAVSLVEDVGINYKGWDEIKAKSYANEKLGDNNFSDRILRLTAIPGQAVSYTVGESKILELRNMAKHELGNKFNIIKFHHVILKNGAVPFGTLQKNIQRYIDSSK